MKKKVVLAAVCCLPLGLLAQDGFTIKGKVGSMNKPAKAYLSYTKDGKTIVDSADLKKGEFVFKGELEEPVMASLSLRHDTAAMPKYGWRDRTSFYLENAKISVTAKDSVANAVVKGSRTDLDNKTLTNMRRIYKKSADSLVAAYNAMSKEQREDSVFRKEAGVIMANTTEGYNNATRRFIAENPDSYISLLAFREVELAYNFNPDTAFARFNRFPEDLKSSPQGEKLAKVIQKGLSTNTGVTAMDFTQTDLEGRPVKLSDYRGQYVLVDFWASWCAPCRAENPNLLKAYNKHKENNFTILGVSLDEEDAKTAWLKAIEKDGMPWKQVSDLKGWKNEAAQLYGISAIPANFLIDPKGKIIARNLRGEELQEKLDSLFE